MIMLRVRILPTLRPASPACGVTAFVTCGHDISEPCRRQARNVIMAYRMT